MHYRPPTPEERRRAVAALKALLADEDPDLTGLPLQLLTGLDTAGHRFTLLADAPAAALQSALCAGLVAPPDRPGSPPQPTHSTATNQPTTPPDHPSSPPQPTHPTATNQPTTDPAPSRARHHRPASTPPRPHPADPPDGSPHLAPAHLLPATPGWGLIALHSSPTLLIEVPHPDSDRFTARLGLALFHAIPDAALLVAGAHRRHADVAHDAGSLFHAFAQTLGTTELQLHGFAATSAPGTDAVLSAGAGRPTGLHRTLTKTLTHQGFRVRHHEHLAGRTNAQGIAAATRGSPFLHLELAPIPRSHRRDRVVKAITDAWHQQGH